MDAADRGVAGAVTEDAEAPEGGADAPEGGADAPEGGADAPEGDVLPEDLDASAYVGPYTFPDIRRRRIPAVMYLLVAAGLLALWVARRGHDPVLVDDGFLACAIGLAAVAVYHVLAAWPLAVDDADALVAAAGAVGFPVGHASAQLGWRGLRSRPTWRILLYSAEDRPEKRGLVLVDGVTGAVVEHFVEDNPEDWTGLSPGLSPRDSSA